MNLKNLPPNFKPDEVIKGEQGEQIVAHILRREGYFVTKLSDINERGRGGAPGMRSQNGFMSLPDLQAALRGRLGYCEVKWKKRADFTRITQREEHGIDKVCWDHYCKVKAETGAPTFLFIYERKTGATLYNTIDNLDSVKRYTPKMGRGGMMFFPRASFYLWGRVVPVESSLYIQLDMFQEMEGNGDKLFGVIRHQKELVTQ